MADQIAAQLQGLHFSSLRQAEAAWQPAVNVYAGAERIEVCVDLAGVRKQDIKVDVEPRRLAIRGHRALPESGAAPREGRILVMEIADGDFERVIEFAADVDPDRVTARQDNGWLWITLPIASREGLS
ncbi:MAG: Hsp20/alpha crystallin family protein [Verrucomicrobiaceae bacterium]|nr:Hsp20/alpha crystallin family protein [Verrucomicrobiaceae bacterium]